ncbi:hypothetical protein B0H16DRAFT_1576568 [Mycena metata]|uniref:Secreted protein n=1 Tax=Mycena metata TaxID=1033252 RepID=A0AAD7I4U9_9AGAR|nr:hypothetical protein B0H16DRAFT_1576568 [Mycena metata]
MWMRRSSSSLMVSIPAVLGLVLALGTRKCDCRRPWKNRERSSCGFVLALPPRPPVSHYNSLYIPSSPPSRQVR